MSLYHFFTIIKQQPRTGPAVPPKSAKAKLEGKRLSGLNEACSQSDHESRYQALKDQPMPKVCKVNFHNTLQKYMFPDTVKPLYKVT